MNIYFRTTVSDETNVTLTASFSIFQTFSYQTANRGRRSGEAVCPPQRGGWIQEDGGVLTPSSPAHLPRTLYMFLYDVLQTGRVKAREETVDQTIRKPLLIH